MKRILALGAIAACVIASRVLLRRAVSSREPRAVIRVLRAGPVIARLADHEERLAGYDRKFGALFAAMSDACESAGLPAPDKEATQPMPRLRVVG